MTLVRQARRAGLALIVSAGLALGAVTPGLAQAEISPEHLAIAREYVELSDRAGIYELRIIDLGTSIMRLLIQQNPALADPVADAVQDVATQYLGEKGALYDQFARIYASRFTIEEIREILAFYSTPTGAKLLEQNAGINQDLTNVLGLWENNARTEFMSRVRALMRQAGHNV